MSHTALTRHSRCRLELASSGLRDGVTQRSPHALLNSRLRNKIYIYTSQRRRNALYDFVVYFTSFLVYGVNQALITRFYPTYLRTEIKLPVRDLLYCPEVLIFTPALLACFIKRRKCSFKKRAVF